MPEGLEAEIYRRSAERALHRRIAAVDVDERQAMAPEIRSVLPGAVFTSARRHGKLVLLDTAGPDGEGPTLGLHFGMTGRLVVDATTIETFRRRWHHLAGARLGGDHRIGSADPAAEGR